MTIEELNHAVAEIVGDEGFEEPLVCGTCGHTTWHPTINRALCLWDEKHDIGRGKPKGYAGSLDLLVPVVEAWCQPRKLSWLIHGNHWTPGRVYADIDEHPTREYEWNGEQGPTPASALAEAFLEAVKEYGP